MTLEEHADQFDHLFDVIHSRWRLGHGAMVSVTQTGPESMPAIEAVAAFALRKLQFLARYCKQDQQPNTHPWPDARKIDSVAIQLSNSLLRLADDQIVVDAQFSGDLTEIAETIISVVLRHPHVRVRVLRQRANQRRLSLDFSLVRAAAQQLLDEVVRDVLPVGADSLVFDISQLNPASEDLIVDGDMVTLERSEPLVGDFSSFTSNAVFAAFLARRLIALLHLCQEGSDVRFGLPIAYARDVALAENELRIALATNHGPSGFGVLRDGVARVADDLLHVSDDHDPFSMQAYRVITVV